MKNLSNFVYLLALFLVAPTTTTQQAPTFECGLSRFTSRNTGESETVLPGEFPWLVDIQGRRTSNGHGYSCSGTLISDRHVLTAAHCIQTVTYVSLGDGSYATQHKFDARRIFIENISTFENDMAIITLSTPANFTDKVQPACLPFEDDLDQVNDNIVLTGWVLRNESNTLSYVLLKTETNVVPWLECQQTAGVENFTGDNVICSDGSQGDDGGPINYFNLQCGRWFVIGVARKSDYSHVGINNGANVFSRVRANLESIRNHTGVASPIDCSTSIELPTSTPPSTTKQPTPFTCAGKSNGNYPNPVSTCSNTFYMCSNGYPYLLNCASNLVYRADIGVCDWPYNVAGCY